LGDKPWGKGGWGGEGKKKHVCREKVLRGGRKDHRERGRGKEGGTGKSAASALGGDMTLNCFGNGRPQKSKETREKVRIPDNKRGLRKRDLLCACVYNRFAPVLRKERRKKNESEKAMGEKDLKGSTKGGDVKKKSSREDWDD